MLRRKFIIPLSIPLFIALVLIGTYFVRREILRKHMLTAMELQDTPAMKSLAESWPAPVNVRDRGGRTPLHMAVELGDSLLVELLIVKGADVSARDFWEFRDLLRSTGPPSITPDHFAIAGGRTPLHLAAYMGKAKAAEVLIARGADVKAEDNHGRTPLHHAAPTQEPQVALLLIANGADVNAKDKDGWRPLHWAAAHGCGKVADLLITSGADLNAKDNGGWMPLHRAALRVNVDVVQVLIAKGAEVNARMDDGKTPFALARRSRWGQDAARKARTVEILLKHGATE